MRMRATFVAAALCLLWPHATQAMPALEVSVTGAPDRNPATPAHEVLPGDVFRVDITLIPGPEGITEFQLAFDVNGLAGGLGLTCPTPGAGVSVNCNASIDPSQFSFQRSSVDLDASSPIFIASFELVARAVGSSLVLFYETSFLLGNSQEFLLEDVFPPHRLSPDGSALIALVIP